MLFQRMPVQQLKFFERALSSAVIGDTCQSQNPADRIRRQQPFFHIAVTYIEIEHHQHPGCQLRQREVMRTLRM